MWGWCERPIEAETSPAEMTVGWCYPSAWTKADVFFDLLPNATGSGNHYSSAYRASSHEDSIRSSGEEGRREYEMSLRIMTLNLQLFAD